MKKFLIVKTSALGDILHTFPVIQFLRHRFPDAQIDWVVEESGIDLVCAHPHITHSLTIATKKWRKNLLHKATWKGIFDFCKKLRTEKYDCVFDLQGNIKSGLITFITRGKHKVGFARKSVPEWPNLFFTSYRYNPPAKQNIRSDYLSIVKQFFKDHSPETIPTQIPLSISVEQKQKIQKILVNPILKNKKKIMVCPGSAWTNKQLTEETLENFLLGIRAHFPSSFLFVWGSEQEKEGAQRLQQKMSDNSIIIERLPLPVLQNLMSEMDLVIAMDSLPLHLAGTTKTTTYSFFGASSAQKYCPQGVQHHSLQESCPYGRTFEKRCPVLRTCPTGLCIRGLSAENVLKDFFRKKVFESKSNSHKTLKETL